MLLRALRIGCVDAPVLPSVRPTACGGALRSVAPSTPHVRWLGTVPRLPPPLPPPSGWRTTGSAAAAAAPAAAPACRSLGTAVRRPRVDGGDSAASAGSVVPSAASVLPTSTTPASTATNTASATAARAAALARVAAALAKQHAKSARSVDAMHEVLAIWAEFQRQRYPPSTAMVSAALRAYSALGAHSVCTALFQHCVQHDPELALTPATRQVAASAMQRMDVDTLQLVADVYDRARKPVPRFQLEALLITCLKAGSPDQVAAAAQQVQALAGQLTPQVYHALAERALKDGNVPNAAAVLHRLFFQQSWPETFVFRGSHYRRIVASLIFQAIATHDTSSMLIGLQILEQLSLTTHYGTLTRMLAAAANQGDAALAAAALQGLEASEYPVRTHHLHSCMYAYAKAGRIQDAIVVLQRLERLGVVADPSALDVLVGAVAAFWKGRGQDSILRLEDFMPDGVVPLQLINVVLRVYSINGYIFPARSLFDSVPMLYGVQPTADTYAALMECCAHPRRPRVSDALDLAQEMGAKGIPLNSSCYSALACCLLLSWSHTTHQAYDMVTAAAAAGTPVSFSTYSKFLRRFGRDQDLDGVLLVVEDMKRAGHWMTPPLTAYLARQGMTVDA